MQRGALLSRWSDGLHMCVLFCFTRHTQTPEILIESNICKCGLWATHKHALQTLDNGHGSHSASNSGQLKGSKLPTPALIGEAERCYVAPAPTPAHSQHMALRAYHNVVCW
jgi:hypothetical protein